MRPTVPAPGAQQLIAERIAKLSGYRSIFACWVAAILGKGR